MVCSICKEAGHNAKNCNSQYITEWTENIKRFWIYGHNNSVENDQAVKEWVRTSRDIKMPLINRLWEKIRGVNHEKRWWYLSQVDRERFVQTRFILTKPYTVNSFRERIATYVRPAEQEPIAEALEARDRQIEANRQQRQRERVRQDLERQERLISLRIAQRQQVTAQLAQDPNAIVRRNLQQDFERAHQMFRRVEAQAIQALKPKRQVIQCKMDPLETEYFENTDCPICLEALTPSNTVALNCRHTCCVLCLKQTLNISNKRTCPTCRADIKTIHFKSTISPDNFNTISAQINSLV